jgi:Flp pilus assembly protein CpaB
MTASATERQLTGRNESILSVTSLEPPKRWRPSWIALGVMLAALAGLLGAYVFSAATDTIGVVVAARDLGPGELLGPADVRVVEMGRTGELRAVLSDQQDLVLGRAARGPIPAGTVLNTDLFTAPEFAIPAGKVVVGGAFGAGAVPTGSLRPGDRVELLRVATEREQLAGGASGDVTATALGTGVVWSVEGEASTESRSQLVWVSLLVDMELRGAVAQAAADDRLRLGLIGGGG